ncbi:MAG: esterase-like activity of phytase family protein [Acidobacteriota bacterium]
MSVSLRVVSPPPEVQHGAGPLRWLGGYVLTSSESRFGGFSGLLVDGDRLAAVSDRGWWWTSRMVRRPNGALSGLVENRVAAILDVDGAPVRGRGRYDAEELARLSGRWVVAFEGEHRLHAYHGSHTADLGGVQPELLASPDLAHLEDNLGLEAVTAVWGEELLLFSEGRGADSDPLEAWISDGFAGAQPRWRELAIEPSDPGFRPTAAATLPGGDVLLAQRKYNPEEGVRIRVFRIGAESLHASGAGATVRPEEWLRLAPPTPIDNIEAMDVGVLPSGKTVVYLLADDNFSDSQDTLLLLFELAPQP